MGEVPEEAIREAEERPAPTHHHAGMSSRDGGLRAHLREAHHLEVPDTVSPATQEGLHDRLHDESGASDD